MKVSDYMSRDPVTIPADANYADAFRIFETGRLHHLPVVDADGRIVGIVTLRDLQLASRVFREAPVEVSEIMHEQLVSVDPDSSLDQAAARMIDARVGCLPVMEDGARLVGMLTETDLLHALRDLLREAG